MTPTPQEKALELVEIFFPLVNGGESYTFVLSKAKKCALRTVDEMIIQNGELYLQGLAVDYYKEKNAFLFAVKQEIEKL